MPAKRIGGLIAATIAAAVAVDAQQADRARALTDHIDRIFKERAYDVPPFGPARWLPDGSAYAIVESARSGGPRPERRPAVAGTEGSEIARYDGVTGARTVLIGASRLVPPGAKEALEVEDYEWSPDSGSNTLNAMFRFPEVYAVGVSVAPVPDRRLYDTIYQERYMGLPQDNAEGYRIGSPISFAAGRARLRRRQRALSGDRAPREPSRGARKAVRPDGLPEPDAREF